MLYISSRSKTDSFTAYRTLSADRAPDGGVFIPYQIPLFSAEELRKIRAMSFGETVAQILNRFFSCKLTPWEVDICSGKMPLRIKSMSHRLLFAECFHNPVGSYEYMEKHLFEKLTGGDASVQPTGWFKIALRIALLFAIYSAMPETVANGFDVSVSSDGFLDPMAAWYARKMGLPIGTILCSCRRNSTLWDFIHRGELSTAAAFGSSGIDQIEGLVYHSFGINGVNELLGLYGRKGVYRLDGEGISSFSYGLAAAVVGPDRITDIISSLRKTNEYEITASAAICYGGLQDYRASTGESRNTLILMDSNPKQL